MTFETLENVNATQGFAQIFVYVNDVTNGLFSNLLLFSLFVIIAMASYLSSERLRGKGDFKVSLSVAGFVTSGAGLIMLLVDGLINTWSVVIVVILTSIFTTWMLTSSKN